MFLLPLMFALGEVPDNSGYYYIQRECVAQNDGHQPIFWGLDRGTCEDVALADRGLNIAYRRAISRLATARRTQLRNEQRRWIFSKNKTCKLSADETITSYAEAECFIREAELRTAVLRQGGL